MLLKLYKYLRSRLFYTLSNLTWDREFFFFFFFFFQRPKFRLELLLVLWVNMRLSGSGIGLLRVFMQTSV